MQNAGDIGTSAYVILHAGWWRYVGCLKLQVSFRKRANDLRALLREIDGRYQHKCIVTWLFRTRNDSCTQIMTRSHVMWFSSTWHDSYTHDSCTHDSLTYDSYTYDSYTYDSYTYVHMTHIYVTHVHMTPTHMTWRLHYVADIEASGHVMSHDSSHVTRLFRTQHDSCTRNMTFPHVTWHVHTKRHSFKRAVTCAECGWHWGKWVCHHLRRASALWPLPGFVVCVAGCCRLLQYAAVCCSVLQCAEPYAFKTLPGVAVWCSVLRCVAALW